MNKLFKHSLSSEILFKKYKGQGLTLKEVIHEDIEYIKWLHKKNLIKFDDEAWRYFCEQAGRPQKWSYGSSRRMI